MFGRKEKIQNPPDENIPEPEEKKKKFPNYCVKCGQKMVRIIRDFNEHYDPMTGDKYYSRHTLWVCTELKDARLYNLTGRNYEIVLQNNGGHVIVPVSLEDHAEIREETEEVEENDEYIELVESVEDLLENHADIS